MLKLAARHKPRPIARHNGQKIEPNEYYYLQRVENRLIRRIDAARRLEREGRREFESCACCARDERPNFDFLTYGPGSNRSVVSGKAL